MANEDNPPLVIGAIQVSGVSRKLLFVASPGASYEVFYGNPLASRPSYDLERILPFLETTDLPEGVLARQQLNPEFVGPQPAKSEQYPWLIGVAVAGAAVVVAMLLFGVLRRARLLLPPPD